MVVATMAAAGVPRVVTDAARRQNRPSRPIAKRIRVPIIRIALSVGGSDTIESIVIICRPRAPKSACAASAAGSVERASSPSGSTSSSATLTRA